LSEYKYAVKSEKENGKVRFSVNTLVMAGIFKSSFISVFVEGSGVSGNS
jgi:hypothetical protein